MIKLHGEDAKLNARGREDRGREQPEKAIGAISACYTSAAVKNEGKPARRSAQIRSELNSGVTCARSGLTPVHGIAIRFHANFDTLSSRRPAPDSRSPFLGPPPSPSPPATPGLVFFSDATIRAKQ